jgi:hypothetical protein
MLDCHDIINMSEVLEEMGQAGRKHLQSVMEDNQTAIDISDRRPKTSSGDSGVYAYGFSTWRGMAMMELSFSDCHK